MATKRKVTKKKSTGRQRTPIRFAVLRRDGTIGRAQRTIEDMLGLPPGSVRLVHPSGRKIRADAKVEKLLDSWGWWDS